MYVYVPIIKGLTTHHQLKTEAEENKPTSDPWFVSVIGRDLEFNWAQPPLQDPLHIQSTEER